MARKHRCFTVTDSALCDTTATALEESRDRPKQGHVPADPRREGRELVLNLLERFWASVSNCYYCDVRLSNILFLILTFKRNFLFGLAWPESHWQLPMAQMLICQEFRLASCVSVHRWGCVVSPWTLTSRLLRCRPVRKPPNRRLAGHVARFPCTVGSWKLSVVYLCGSYSGETEVTTNQKTSHVLAFLFLIWYPL